VSRSLYGSAAAPSTQREWFRTGEVPVAVYGLGKMGLPLAAVYAETSGNVTGVDIDESVVEAVNAGRSHVEREPGLQDLVADLTSRGALSATTDGVEAARDASIHVVIVPTLVDDNNEPDLSAVTSVVSDVASGLSPGDLVVVESTLPPRTSRDVLRPLLEDRSTVASEEFGLAFCPERTASGRALGDIRGAHPKVVGGDDDESTRVAELVYNEIVDNDVIPVSDTTTAEAVKVFEGLYRDANIALANELAKFTDELDIDVREAIDAANTQPFCDLHTPGPGVGGHCIPYYPYFVLNWLHGDAPLVATARRVNDGMPGFVVDTVSEGLAAAHEAEEQNDVYAADGGAVEDATVAVLGLTYRAGVQETRASPGVDICEDLDNRGAEVLAADPLVDAEGCPQSTSNSTNSRTATSTPPCSPPPTRSSTPSTGRRSTRWSWWTGTTRSTSPARTTGCTQSGGGGSERRVHDGRLRRPPRRHRGSRLRHPHRPRVPHGGATPGTVRRAPPRRRPEARQRRAHGGTGGRVRRPGDLLLPGEDVLPGRVQRVEALGHEVGYQYEDYADAGGDTELAHALFRNNLRVFRRACDVDTVCMHDTPLSPHDNQELWAGAEAPGFADYDLVGTPTSRWTSSTSRTSRTSDAPGRTSPLASSGARSAATTNRSPLTPRRPSLGSSTTANWTGRACSSTPTGGWTHCPNWSSNARRNAPRTS